ncbi:Flp pilus assembly protein CpaB [Pigmentiphaga litoralis]|uniref:Pilus assembly protein CpaB n=1 Tax=Pigmentiphaga litoralis TaxID=516702 RepID=A0A7Y9IYN9_9BURK|nr:Flp pilus assembly protein CpaB [Pigmentiphaga litoralis]NYE26430.1 pilus assembly protein CpaB [Pigmentiphaga litoralis]NYE85550.1 pilus assembly protein CpaB [Pigmentiphaga litoralis]
MARFRIEKKWGMLAVALSAGAIAAWLSQRYVQARIDQVEAGARKPQVAVLVAAEDLPAGARLTHASIAVRDMPGEWTSDSALTPEHAEAVLSASLSHPVRRGEPILWAHVEAARARSLADKLAAGRRAVTLPVDDMSSVSGLLQPGDLIDLYVSFDHRGKPVTVPLLQGMKVLATGRQVEADSGGSASTPTNETGRSFSTVTLDASPEEAVKLIAARQNGTVTAMLRGAAESKAVSSAYLGDLGKLLGLQEPAPDRAPPKRAQVPIIYGDRTPRTIPKLGEAWSDPVPGAMEGGPGIDATARPPAGGTALPVMPWAATSGGESVRETSDQATRPSALSREVTP